MATTPHMVIGPFGGPGGDQWDDGIYTTVRKVKIRHGDVVEFVQFEYDDNGESKLSPVHGGNGGTIGTIDEVKLDYANYEFITSISGYYSNHQGIGVVVGSLTITSNKKQYGPYGKGQVGEYFSTSSVTGGKIVGFFGRSGWYLDSIGAYYVPINKISIGPFGGTGGEEFNDGTYNTIRRIEVRYNDGDDGRKPFVSIQTVYDNNGAEHWSDDHGTHGGGIVHEVKLDYENNEFLISVSGYLTDDSDDAIVQSLIFESNKNIKYGPYGKAEEKFFSSLATGGKIIGFFGKSSEFINSIGAHFELVP